MNQTQLMNRFGIALTTALALIFNASIARSTPAFEEAILTKINEVRADPQAYATWLSTQRQNYQNNLLTLPGGERILTHEGLSALDNAIAFLQSAPKLSPLSASSELANGARHFGKINRVQRFKQFPGAVAELRSRTQNDPAATVLLMVLSDGDPNRSTRTTLFQPNYQSAGVACKVQFRLSEFCVVALSSPPSQPATGPIASAPSRSTSRVVSPTVQSSPIQASSDIEKAIVEETNRLRSNPTAYAAELENLRQYYTGNLLRLPGYPALQTQEGIAVVDEAIRDLRATAPLPSLSVSQGLSLGARDHVLDLGPKGKAGHYGTDGSDPFTRINRYGTWQGTAGENISFSPIQTAKWHVMQLIIDDGVKSRGHRKALLNPDYRLTGSACGAHSVYGQMCVMTYSRGYTEGKIQGRN